MASQIVALGDGILMTWIEPEPRDEEARGVGGETGGAGGPGGGGGGSGAGHRVRFARLEGDAWSEPATVASGTDFFVNWADFPAPARARDGSLYAHWLRRSGKGAYAYDVHVARSIDDGRTWTRLGKLNDDSTETEHGFVSFVEEERGVRAFWLDGREMAAEGEGHGGGDGESGHGGGDHAGGMGLRTVLIGEKVGESTLLDATTCECCQTAAVVTSRGPLVAYRDRAEGEIRDIAVVRREGSGWSEPETIHADRWEVPGCPVNGPSLSSAGDTVVAAWYTAEGNRGRVLAAFSADSGGSFTSPVEIDADQPMGRVDVDLLPGGDAVVTWLAASGEEGVIRLRRVAPSGRAGATIDLARTEKSRAAGFPRTAVMGSRIVVAWTASGEPSHVRASWIDASGVPSTRAESGERSTEDTEGRVSPEGAEGGASAGPAGRGESPGRGDSDAAAKGVVAGARTAQRSAEGGRGTASEAVREDGARAGAAGIGALPSLAVQDLDGRKRDLLDLTGQPVLLNLWATWCAPCRLEMPDLSKLHEDLSPKGLKVVGLSLDVMSAVDDVRVLVRDEPIPYLVLLDLEGRAASTFKAATLPASFIYDRSGKLVWERRGPLTADDPSLHEAIEAALASTGR